MKSDFRISQCIYLISGGYELDLHDAYEEWFVKGYSLTVITGIQTIRPQYFAARTPESEAMVQDWHAGQELALSERRDQLFEKITNPEPNKPGVDNPD